MLFLRHCKRSFTLIEGVIVVILIGILASFAVPTFMNIKKKAQDNDANTTLRLIRVAERNYRLDMEQFTDCANTTHCNQMLGLDLPPCSSQVECNSKGRWWYYVATSDAGDSFIATADGQNSTGTQLIGTKNWQINNTVGTTVY